MSFKITLYHLWNKIRYYLSFVLLAFYFVMGYLFLFTDEWIGVLPDFRNTIGFVFIAFGLLRFYISYRRYKQKHQHIQSLKKQNKNETV